jgi:serine/threonine protein phosphatase PrpC
MHKEILEKLNYRANPSREFSLGDSHPGQKRKLNEDNYLIDEKSGLFLVADGMGGHDAGEIASKLAVELIFNEIKKALDGGKLTRTDRPLSESIYETVQDAIEEANNQIHCYNLAKGHPEGKGMGTTVSGFWIIPETREAARHIHSFNVGDSRLYSFYHGQLQQLTTDHSHYQLWLDTGKDGEAPKHNIIYKAIGPWRRVLAEQKEFPIRTGETFLLCSDGLSGMLNDNQLEKLLIKCQAMSLQKLLQVLIDAANRAGGKDNITAILVKP